ncbi:hypothetical protein C7534_10112 [Pseudomonas sp. OV226]|jgi:hypothetical protein|nr:hypothetical protein C7534_10112 [Pseudomonas sp. OV226]
MFTLPHCSPRDLPFIAHHTALLWAPAIMYNTVLADPSND